MPNKIKTKGILLQKYITSTFTTIGQRIKLAGPSAEMGTTDLTDLDSTMEKKGTTLVNPGTFSGTLFYDPNDPIQAGLTTDLLAGTTEQWKLVYPDGDTTPSNVLFSGFVTKFEPTGMEIKGYLQADFEITLDGGTLSYVVGTP